MEPPQATGEPRWMRGKHPPREPLQAWHVSPPYRPSAVGGVNGIPYQRRKNGSAEASLVTEIIFLPRHRRIRPEMQQAILNLTARTGVLGARIADTFTVVTQIVERSAYE